MIFEKLRERWHMLLGAFYVIGFVIHNSYLAGFGSYAIDLFQAHYLFTGLVTVVFYATCYAFVALGTNLSRILDTFTNPDDLFPWLLRVLSVPYIAYTLLYIGSYRDLVEFNHSIPGHIFPFFLIAFVVIFFSIVWPAFEIRKFKISEYRVGGIIIAVMSICMALVTLIFTSRLVPEFFSIASATLGLPLAAFVGVGLTQRNGQSQESLDGLHPNTDEASKKHFSHLIGILSLLFLSLYAAWVYTDKIYPKIPSKFGGAKAEFVEMHQNSDVGYFHLIQETEDWVLYVADAPCRVEKVRADTIEKIVYLDTTGIAPEKHLEADQRKAALLGCF